MFKNHRKILLSLRIDKFIEDYKNFLLKENILKNEKDIIYFFTMEGCFIKEIL